MLKDAATLRELARVPLGAGGGEALEAPYLVAHRGRPAERAAGACRARKRHRAGHRRARSPDSPPCPGGVTATVDDRRQGRRKPAACCWSAPTASGRRCAACRRGIGRQAAFRGELAWRTTIAADSTAGQCIRGDRRRRLRHRLPASGLPPGRLSGAAAAPPSTWSPSPRAKRIAEGWSGQADPAHPGAAPCAAPHLRLAQLADDAGPWTAWPIHTVDRRQPVDRAGRHRADRRRGACDDALRGARRGDGDRGRRDACRIRRRLACRSSRRARGLGNIAPAARSPRSAGAARSTISPGMPGVRWRWPAISC